LKKSRVEAVSSKTESKEVVEERNIEEHVLVPKHEVLSPEEAEALLRKLGVSREKLPRILPTDPMVRRLGARLGDIIKITRRSETAGEAVYYRVVMGEG